MPEKKSPRKKLSWNKIASAAKQELLKEAIVVWVRKCKNNFQQFAKRLEKIGNVGPNNYSLGIKHYNLGNYDDAVFRFKFVIKLEPLNYNAHYWLAASYLKLGKKAAARATLQQALAIKPDYNDALHLLEVVNKEEVPSATE